MEPKSNILLLKNRMQFTLKILS